MTTSTNTIEQTARCGCGALQATASGDPLAVYLCSCAECQRKSGSAFTYRAVYPEASVAIAGEHARWRRDTETGNWLEDGFCPTCGTTVIFRIGAWPGTLGVSAGCFANPTFAQPQTHYFASRRHHWLDVPNGTAAEATQPLTST